MWKSERRCSGATENNNSDEHFVWIMLKKRSDYSFRGTQPQSWTEAMQNIIRSCSMMLIFVDWAKCKCARNDLNFSHFKEKVKQRYHQSECVNWVNFTSVFTLVLVMLHRFNLAPNTHNTVWFMNLPELMDKNMLFCVIKSHLWCKTDVCVIARFVSAVSSWCLDVWFSQCFPPSLLIKSSPHTVCSSW